MKWRTLVERSLRYHARSHFGVVLGAAVGSAALIGALAVGDSVRGSLRERAVRRLAHASFALHSRDRFFSQSLGYQGGAALAGALTARPPTGTVPGDFRPISATILALRGTAAAASGEARANHVAVLGVGPAFWVFVGGAPGPADPEGVWLNEALARQLGAKPGDEILLRLNKPASLSAEVPVSPSESQSVGMRLPVSGVLPAGKGGDFSLESSGRAPMNAFVPLGLLGERLDLREKANLLLLGSLGQETQPPVDRLIRRIGRIPILGGLWNRLVNRYDRRSSVRTAGSEEALKALGTFLKDRCTLADYELEALAVPGRAEVEVRSPRIFLEPAVVAAASRAAGTNAFPILTYLANLMWAGTNATPYSMVTAAGPPYVPADMVDDEIVVNQWLAEDLGVRVGDTVRLSYYLPESGGRLEEGTNAFRVRAVAALEGVYADRTLMPDFPGIEKAESTFDWDTAFPLVYKIRPKDEQYWKERRGTPKAFVTLAAGQRMWGTRFGNVTALRFPNPIGVATTDEVARLREELRAAIDPADLGLRFEPVLERALKAASQSQDFGQLFIGFSLFLVVAALLLMELLFRFGLEQRAGEIGTLLALGFAPGQVRRLLLWEGAALAAIGGVAGAVAGLFYARGMLYGLATIWRDAVGGAGLNFHVTASTLAVGLCASALVAVLTIWLTLRQQARQPARELLAGVPEVSAARRGRAAWVAVVCAAGALALLGWVLARGDTANAGAFFGAGALWLVAGLAGASAWLAGLAGRTRVGRLSLGSLALRGCARRRGRSVATVALLAAGCFLVASIGVFRLDAGREAGARGSGTGGFALAGETVLPIFRDLNTSAGREAYGLSAEDLAGVRVVPFRVREGDEASCLNLDRAQRPRLLGVNPKDLAGRFAFAGVAPGCDRAAGWDLLERGRARSVVGPDEVAAIGDANSLQWALGKKLGEAVDYTDEKGRRFKLRLVGAVANSILQGALIVDQAELVRRFPETGGYRVFLVDTPPGAQGRVSAAFTRALQDVGMEMARTVDRLNAFNAVQNTYLGTFQVLGGLGLLLGSAGLGVVVLRNVLERRGELALLGAVGFCRARLHWLVLLEHGALLGLGLGLGVAAAAIAVLPNLLAPSVAVPGKSLAITLAAVLCNGVAWTWLATRAALRGDLLAALRNE